MSTELAVAQTDLPSVQQWELTQRMAQAFAASGLYPNLKNVAQFIVVMQIGRELGIPPGAALRSFSFIGGKPTASAEMLAALVYRDHGDQALKVTQTDDDKCTVEYRRRNWDSAGRITFTMADAIKANLLAGEKANVNWKKYPRAMLRSRAISEAARTAFQDSILGMHTTEELAPDSVMVTEDGEVVLEDTAPRPELPAAPRPDADALTGEILPTDEEARKEFYRLLDGDPSFNQWLTDKKINAHTLAMPKVHEYSAKLVERADIRAQAAAAQAQEPQSAPTEEMAAEPAPTAREQPAGVTALADSMDAWLTASIAKADAWLTLVGNRPDGTPHATDLSAAKSILQEQARLLGKEAAGAMPTGAQAIVEEVARRWTVLGVKLEERQRASQAAMEGIAF